MAKVTVTAAKDFFDRFNNTPRTKGQKFILKSEAVKELGSLVTVDAEGKKAIAAEKKVVEAPKTQGKDMSMSNIKKAPKKGKK